MTPSLTVGMATYRDYDGAYFTLQAMRLDPAARGVQFVIVDNFGDRRLERLCTDWRIAKYVTEKEVTGTAHPRNMIFRHADADFVLVVDCHVLLAPNALARLRQFIAAYPACDDLLQGPMLYDDLTTYASHMRPVWGAGMWGQWRADARAADADAPPFEIPMHGLGLFCMRKASWPGFNERFKGFGGEEGYIHQKVKNRGDRTLCLPFLRWAHRTQEEGVAPKYPNLWEDRLRNYMIGFAEVGLDCGAMIEHFLALGVPRQTIDRVWNGVVRAHGGG